MCQLPEEIIEYIISFTIDRRGYNMELYNQRKKESLPKFKRIQNEIKYFKKLGVSVLWLKGTANQNKKAKEFIKNLKNGKPLITYHTGCYFNLEDEEKLFTPYPKKLYNLVDLTYIN